MKRQILFVSLFVITALIGGQVGKILTTDSSSQLAATNPTDSYLTVMAPSAGETLQMRAKMIRWSSVNIPRTNPIFMRLMKADGTPIDETQSGISFTTTGANDLSENITFSNSLIAGDYYLELTTASINGESVPSANSGVFSLVHIPYSMISVTDLTGRNYSAGETIDLTWTATPDVTLSSDSVTSLPRMIIKLYRSNGTLASPSLPSLQGGNDGQQTITLPLGLAVGSYYIDVWTTPIGEVNGFGGVSPLRVRTGTFNIVPATNYSITFNTPTSPDGNDSFIVGSPLTVSWSSQLPTNPAPLLLELLNASTGAVVGSGIDITPPHNNQYYFSALSGAPGSYRYRLTYQVTGQSVVTATSPSFNLIADPATILLPDITAPSVPTGFTATPISSSRINLSWNASNDTSPVGQTSSGVAGYLINVNGNTLPLITGTSYQHTGLSTNTFYGYGIKAVDRVAPVANQSAPTTASATTLNVSTNGGNGGGPGGGSNPKSVRLISPNGGEVLNRNQVNVFTWQESNIPTSATRVLRLVNPANPTIVLASTTVTTANAFSWPANSALLIPGSYKAEIRVTSGGQTVSDLSNNSFTVTASTTVANPPPATVRPVQVFVKNALTGANLSGVSVLIMKNNNLVTVQYTAVDGKTPPVNLNVNETYTMSIGRSGFIYPGLISLPITAGVNNFVAGPWSLSPKISAPTARATSTPNNANRTASTTATSTTPASTIQPKFQITFPVAGLEWPAGSSQTVLWLSEDIPAENLIFMKIKTVAGLTVPNAVELNQGSNDGTQTVTLANNLAPDIYYLEFDTHKVNGVTVPLAQSEVFVVTPSANPTPTSTSSPSALLQPQSDNPNLLPALDSKSSRNILSLAIVLITIASSGLILLKIFHTNANKFS
ncbi:MAG: hypothetical protein AAB453_01830 [Patescibacteria group bacterium]